ncbi:YIP1 family protein [Mycobacteroides abscessus]|nr:YIP1 family protein [Mycobacteroides abscessus]MDM2237651.1 YIP1 family protein [Mycobacteroides abscessus]MDM2246996.1 YIP1 family protein [Mycobacteroides abscessus]MDM2258066.1 YIP1 family protein [Mycobacteroides abscessus]MDM2261723.1 YIP1 family protein [Mycobacteroides abscessus]MDM2266254.1 YIP1 family protein [Mycobacteroides abscessus]
MSGNERSTKQLIAVTDCRDLVRPAAAAQKLPSPDLDTSLVSGHERGRRAAAFASVGVLVVGAVAALHNLYRSGDDAAELISWSGLLLLALTALGGGIKLAMWSARPVITALFDRAKERLAEPVLAVVASGAVIVGALGMWWTLRGGYAIWWQQVSGEHRWTLLLGVGQMLVAVAAGAALFTGGRYVTGLAKDALTDSGLLIERDRSAGKRRAPEGLWHPGLVAALIGGGLALVVMTAWLTPKLAPTISGADVLSAIAAIVAVLLWAIGANLGWWKGLAGLWQWATDASQKTAAMSGVVALLMFSAGGLGLGWFTPATVPQAHAQCPPDCGGGSNGGSYGPDASQFQPPQMPSQMPDYQGGINQPPLDQNNGVSIYNTQAPSVSNNGVQGSSGQQGPQQGWDQPAHGTQIPDYQNATPYTQGPGRPNPDLNPGSQGGQANPGSDAGSQGGQPNQGVQQQAPQQPQENPAQQPDQQPQQSDSQRIDDLTRQLQDQQQQSTQDRQRIDDLTKQLQQNKQNQKQQQSPRFPSKDDKKDRGQQDRDDQSGDNDLTALLMGAASTRRRKQDDQQGPDTQALGQDASQAVQGLPGDVQTYVQSGQQIGQSSGQAAQGFGSAAQAGASLASSAQSGAVNPQDAITVVQGVSQGIQGTADAVNAGSQIVKTAQGEADQVAQAFGDANPQLKPQTEQFTQLNDQASQATDLVGQGAQLTSQGAGAVNSATSGTPDMSGTATAVNGPGDVPQPPTPNADAGSLASVPGVKQAQPQQPGPSGVDAPRAERGFMDGMGKRWSETWRGAASLVGLGGDGAPGVADAWKGAIEGHVEDVFTGPMTPFVGPIFLANNLSDQAMASDNAADFAGQQTTDLAIMATSLIPGIGSAGRVLREAGVAGRAATVGSEATRLTETATRYHSALDNIAQNMRTTGAMSTREGTDLIASGKRDLTPAQRALVQPGEQLAKNPSLHAETTLIEAAKAAGLTPQQIAVTRLICPGCTTAIVETGGEILPGGLGAVWPK